MIICGGGVRLPARRDASQRNPPREADADTSGWACFYWDVNSTINSTERQKPRDHFSEFLLHIFILHDQLSNDGMDVGLNYTHSSFISLIDAFLFRKSLPRQQEGDRGGQNPRSQHVHEGIHPAGSLGYLLQLQDRQQWAERCCRRISTGSDISAAVCTSSSARRRCRSLLFALPRAHITSDRL